MLSLLLLPLALAAPAPVPHAGPIHVPIVRRTTTAEHRVASLPQAMDAIRLRYGFTPVNRKRSDSSTALTDEANDSSYSAIVGVGTPAQEFNLILDTGSSDLWITTSQCSACSGTPVYNPSASATFKNDSSSLQITYGSGAVTGYVSEDNVTLSGFTVPDQVFLAASDTSSSFLNDGLSGIMGLGFDTISTLPTTPFWQSLYNQSMLPSPVFSFYLERYSNDPQHVSSAPGGTFTLGGTNPNYYTGNIDFINMPSGSTPSYWLQQIQNLTIQGQSIPIPSTEGLAAIDTGTSLIGAPTSLIQQIWSNVPGSVALNGTYQGMYAFPCNTSVSVSISFGSNTWPINTGDINIGQISTNGSQQMCAGGIFDLGTTTGSGSIAAPSWIFGDTFLKNVYSVFQADPPAVGFAQLVAGLISSSGASSGTPTYSPNGGFPTSTSGVSPSGAPPRTTISVTTLCLAVSFFAGFLIAF